MQGAWKPRKLTCYRIFYPVFRWAWSKLIMTEFFSMGGYGAFVWSAYGLALVILSFNLIRAVGCERRLRKDMARYFSSMA